MEKIKYEKYKLFSFSTLRPKWFDIDHQRSIFRLTKSPTKITLSFYVDEAVQHFVLGLFKDQTFEVGLNVNGIGNYSYQWFPPEGLSCEDCPNPEVTPESDTEYQVVVTDNNTGCTYDQTIGLKLISECSEEIIAMPNIFSPNDDGQNDELKMSTALVTQIERYQIFDRWGGLVFETNDLSQGWDGTHLGKRLQQGVYIYLIEARCELDGSTFKKSGDVTLIK